MLVELTSVFLVAVESTSFLKLAHKLSILSLFSSGLSSFVSVGASSSSSLRSFL